MKIKLSFLLFASLVLLSIVSLVSAMVVNPTSFTNSTLPSDDSNARSLNFNFNITNDNPASSLSISLTSSSGLSSWNPSFSTSSDAIAPNSTNFYTITLTVPKYTTSAIFGNIELRNASASSQILATIPVSVSVNTLQSLVFTTGTVILSKETNTSTITLKNDGNTALNNVAVSIDNGAVRDRDDNTLSISASPSSFNLNPQESRIINVSYNQDPQDINLLLGSSSTPIRASAGSASVASTITFTQEFCDFGEVGGDVDIVSVKDDSSSNGNFDWELLDNIELSIKARNNNNDDEQDVTVAILLYDQTNGETLYEDDQTISISDDDDEEFYFNFTLPADTPDGAKLYVKAFSDDAGEEEQCSNHWGGQTFEPINIKSQDDYEIGFTDIKVDSPLMCGASSSVDFKVHNIGDKDQRRVLVSLINDELGIDQDVIISNLDAGSSKRVTFNIQIPQDVSEKTYQLGIEARHEYDRNDDTYDSVTDRTLRAFKVEGNCVASDGSGSSGTDKLMISPTLQSEAVAGKDLVIKATVKNVNADSGSFSVIPFGYESWATIKGVEPSVVVLAKGESRDVTITLTPKDSVSGEQRFTIRASKGTIIADQEAVVFIKGSTNGSGLVNSIKENWVIWTIVIANIVLIVAIIIAFVSVSKRNRKE